MAIPHAKPAEVIDIKPLGDHLPQSATTTLVKTEQLEVLRLVLPTGKEIPPHKVEKDIMIQCLEGRLAFSALGQTRELEAGQMLYLPGGEEHSVKGLENASALLTILL